MRLHCDLLQERLRDVLIDVTLKIREDFGGGIIGKDDFLRAGQGAGNAYYART